MVAAARAAGLHLRPVDDDHVGISVGEDADEAALASVCAAFGVSAPTRESFGGLGDHSRTELFLTHPVFSDYVSETEFLRYLRTLADRDSRSTRE